MEGNLDLRFDGMAQGPHAASSSLTQEVLNQIADRYLKKVRPSNPDEFDSFLTYMEKVRKVLVVDVKTGSLILKLECRTVKILDDLWDDYRTGNLNKVAQSYLVTKDILKLFGLSSFKLTSNIEEEEYRACRQRLIIDGRFEKIIIDHLQRFRLS